MGLESSRRRLLAYSGLLTAGFAGCLGENAGSDDQSADNETEADENDEGGDDDHDHSSDHEIGSPESAVEVGMVTDDDGYHFIPHVVHIEQGGSVEWRLESGSHDTTAYHPDVHGDQQRIPDEAEPWKSEQLSEEGETYSRTFDVEGVYDYVCTPHEGDGMVGTVVVGWPDPDGQPGLRSPADSYPDAATEQLERYNEQVREVLEVGENDDRDGEDGEDGHSDDDHDHEDHEH